MGRAYGTSICEQTKLRKTHKVRLKYTNKHHATSPSGVLFYNRQKQILYNNQIKTCWIKDTV